MKKIKLHWQIFIAMGVGIIVALIFGERSLVVAPLGEIFMRLLKMVVVPLVFTSIVTGVAGLGSSKSLGRLGSKTFGYYLMTSMIAILIGLTLTNIIRPGDGIQISENTEEFDPSQLKTPDSLGGIILRMIPTNPLQAATENDILGLIFFSIVFGYAITLLKDKRRTQLQNLFDSLFHAMMKLTRGIITFAPIGVFGLITKAVATAGFDLFIAVGKYMATIGLGIFIHLFIVLPLIYYFFTKISPMKHYKAMASAMAMAFSTCSSGATLPVTMDCVENKVGVSNKITSFVLPLGSTVNMDGTALYECAGVLFIAQVLGIDLSFTQQFAVVITAFLASVGAAAIPKAGLVMIFIVLDAVGLGNHPEVGFLVGTMLAVDRPLDMLRTMTNVTSDSIGATIIAKSEGETNVRATKRRRCMTETIENVEPTTETADEKLVGISGLLILPAISFVLGAIIGVVGLIASIGMYSDVARGGFGGLYALELIVLTGLIGFLIYAAILFFKKKKEAPRIIIILYIVSIVSSVILLVFELGAGAEMFAVETGKQLVREVIGAAIWIPYFKVSKRVKATFVN